MAASSAAKHPRFDEAVALHRRLPTVDGHADSILTVLEGKRTLVERSEVGHVDFPRALDGGLAATVQAAWPRPETYPVAARQVLICLEGILAQIDQASNAELATTAQDVRRCHAEGKLAVLLDVEGAEALHGEIAMLRVLYRLGVRILQPVWNFRNEAADGVEEEGHKGGLSKFGRELVAEMNRLGMALDLSHLNEACFYDVLERSEDPVLFTHGNCRALFDHRRNLTDDQIRALARNGGVMGISFVKSFIAAGGERGTREEAVAALKAAPEDVRTVADHVDHVVQLVGPAHVAYGSDFDGTDVLPSGLDDVSLVPNLTAVLLERGYREDDLAKILGGNYLRVFETVFGG